MSDLSQRLRALKREPASGAAGGPEALARLEADLIGEPADGLSLRARLERLVEATVRRNAVPARGRMDLEDLVEGRRVRNDHGEFFLVESGVHLETAHGELPFSRLQALLPEAVGILTGQPELGAFDLARAVFLDTETTGLSGGSGTAAFLVGVGFVDGERFQVRQYFMRDYHEEPALLDALARDLAGFEHLVTFNGKLFDVPLLEARYRLNRAAFPLAATAHLDLLHPARRLWKMRLSSCRLQFLEHELLGVRRRGDIPGDEIPRVYFDYLRSRDARLLPRILEHNRMDVLSLAALAAHACQWLEGGRAEDPRDVFSLARVFERAERYDRSDAEYEKLLEVSGPVRAASLMRLAARAKRAGHQARALELWIQAAEEGDLLALRELAVHHEHRARDLAAALEASDRALRLLASAPDPLACRGRADFQRRRQRVLRKLSRRAAAQVPAPGRNEG